MLLLKNVVALLDRQFALIQGWIAGSGRWIGKMKDSVTAFQD
jgi:hypothetical protein